MPSGADIEANDQTGPTPLHYAALSNKTESDTEKAEMKDTEILELLMDNGADCNMLDCTGIVTPRCFQRKGGAGSAEVAK